MEDREDWSQCIFPMEKVTLEVPKDADSNMFKGYYAMLTGGCDTCEMMDECSLYAEHVSVVED